MQHPTPEKTQALHHAIQQITKTYGVGAIMQLDDPNAIAPVPAISTGSLGLDLALGIGGIPRGRIVEIYGPEASGKTTMALSIAVQAQRQGGIVAIVDAEHALDVSYAQALGLTLSTALIAQPDSGEQALEITETLIRSNATDVVIVDSVAALVPQSELEGQMGDATMGAQARLMSQALRKLTAAVSKSHCSLIFINQIRNKIGMVFGNPETTAGGHALKFYASVRLDVRKIESIKEGSHVRGARVRVTVVKNKTAPPFRKAELDIIFGKGIDTVAETVNLALAHGLLTQQGSALLYRQTQLGRDTRSAAQTLTAKPDLLADLQARIRALLPTQRTPILAAKPDETMEHATSPSKTDPNTATTVL
jgi:recombination protein RecA